MHQEIRQHLDNKITMIKNGGKKFFFWSNWATFYSFACPKERVRFYKAFAQKKRALKKPGHSIKRALKKACVQKKRASKYKIFRSLWMRLFLAISKHCGGKRIWNVVRIFSDIWDDYNVIITLKAAGGSVLCNIFFVIGKQEIFSSDFHHKICFCVSWSGFFWKITF